MHGRPGSRSDRSRPLTEPRQAARVLARSTATYYYGKRLTRQSHGQRVVVTNTRSAVANRDAPHPAGIAQLPLKMCPTRRVCPHTTPLVYRAEEHMNFRLRRAAAAAAFGACHFGRARAHLPEPASWPRASRSVYVCPPRPLSLLTIGVRVPAPAPEPHDRFKKDE